MAEDKKTVATPTPPVVLTVVGTGDGLVQGVLAKTPPDQPNVIISVISPALAIVVRFANLFLTTLVGLLVAAMTPDGGRLLYTSDFLHMIILCAGLAFPAAALGAIKDVITIGMRLEQKFPLLTGGV